MLYSQKRTRKLSRWDMYTVPLSNSMAYDIDAVYHAVQEAEPSQLAVVELHQFDAEITSTPIQRTESVNERTVDVENEGITTPPNTVVEARQYWNHPRINMWRTFAAFFSFFVFGMSDGSYGLEIHYALRYTIVSLIFLSPFAGYSIASIVNSMIHVKFGQRGVAILGPGCHLLSYIVIACHPPYPVLVVFYMFVGFGNGLIEAAWGAWLGNMSTANQESYLHACYALGATISPLIVGGMSGDGGLRWWYFYYIMAGISAVEISTSTWAFWQQSGKVYQEENAREESQTTGRTREVLGTNVKVSLGGWIVTFMEKARLASSFSAGISSTGFWAGMTVGRIFLSFFTARIGEFRAVVLYIIISLALELLFWLIPSFIVSSIAVAFLGLFLGPLFPTAVVLVMRLLPRHLHVGSIGFATAVGGSGGAIFPFVVGAIAQARGVRSLQPVILALLNHEIIQHNKTFLTTARFSKGNNNTSVSCATMVMAGESSKTSLPSDDETTIKVAPKKVSGTIKLKKPAPKQKNPGNWRDGAVIDDERKKGNDTPSTNSVGSPGPVVNQLDDSVRDAFPTGRPMDDDLSLQICKQCKRSVSKKNITAHVLNCLRAKKEKNQRKKEQKEARDRERKAANGEKKDEEGDTKMDDDDEDEDDAEKKGPGGLKMYDSKADIQLCVEAERIPTYLPSCIRIKRCDNFPFVTLLNHHSLASRRRSSFINKMKRRRLSEDQYGRKRVLLETRNAPFSAEQTASLDSDDFDAATQHFAGPVDVERQCGVMKDGVPCARSLTCKSHSMGAKRAVAGRSLPYDMLLTAYQKKNQAKQQKAAIDANAPLEDEEAANGPIDSDEELASVMHGLQNWNPQPLVQPLVHVPIETKYRRERLYEQLHNATNGFTVNIFKVVGYGAQKLPPGHPGLADADGDADGESDNQSGIGLGIGMANVANRRASGFNMQLPPQKRPSGNVGGR
ncbi:hypothetical protein B7494_g5869 [Chlorociboria aeruginascens]|nr:hypothetical protein B7494_g5869 [Chlorociboria aeruginascens]